MHKKCILVTYAIIFGDTKYRKIQKIFYIEKIFIFFYVFL